MNPFGIQLLMMLGRNRQRSTAMDYPYLNDSQRIPGDLPGFEKDVPTAVPEFDMEQARRDARREGLGALGISLLRGAPTGDFAGSLAEGLAGMAETRNRLMQEAEQRARLSRAERRQELEDARQGRESQERILSTQQGREIAGETFERQQALWGRDDQRRAASGRAAEETVAGIAAVVGADSPEARRAKALAELGEDTDLDRLDKLYEDVIARDRFPEDAERKAQAEIDAIRAKVKAGVEEDPLAAGRRAEEALAIQRRQSELYGRSLETRGGGGVPSAGAFNDDVKTEADKLYSIKVEALKASKGEPGKMVGMEKDAQGNPKIVYGGQVTEQELIGIRRQAEAEAAENVRRRYNQRGGAEEKLSIPGDPNPDRPLSQRVIDVEAEVGNLTPAERTQAERLLRTMLPRDVVAGIRRARGGG